MNALLESLPAVTGPLSLIAFLAVVALAFFRRSVNDKRGLEYLYNLLRVKLTREQFYRLATDVVRRAFWATIVIFIASLAAFVAGRLVSGGIQTVLNVKGDYIETGQGDDLVVKAPIGGDLTINQGGRPDAAGPRRPGNTIIASPGDSIPSADAGRAAEDAAAASGDRVFVRGTGNIVISEGTGNVILSQGEGNILIGTETGRKIRLQAQGAPLDPALRHTESYRIDVIRGVKTTQRLRELYGLQSIGDWDETRRVRDYPNGVYGFFATWLIGRTDAADDFWAPEAAGAATLEVHKRPSGIVAVAGFVDAATATRLLDPDGDTPVDVRLFVQSQPTADNAVAIPIARIQSITIGLQGDVAPEVSDNGDGDDGGRASGGDTEAGGAMPQLADLVEMTVL